MRQEQKQRHLRVFFSYAQADQGWYEYLVKHLSQLKRDGLIEGWSHQQILPGVDRAKEIDQALYSAHIILLLISADFLASDACDQQMQHALERYKRGEASVVPVIVRPCDWQHSPFAHLQCLPRTGKPISTWDRQDEAFLTVARELRRIIAQQQFPSPPLSEVQRQNRSRLLKRVRTTWIEDLLEHSLHQTARIDLHLQNQPDALENSWRLQYQELNQEPHPLPDGTSIAQVYDDAEGELLILGEPGVGKTTLLLRLAQTLLDRAQADERVPMPVVFNLSSRAQKQKQQSLAAWLYDELRTKYQVPPRVAKQWIEERQILPLLDGLDEVAEGARVACVQAIIAYYSYHEDQPGTPLVVCCRSQEYQALSLRLPFFRAVSILPLTEQQIDDYLSGAQEQLEGLRQALHDDTELFALAQRPLMLNIFTLAYQGATVKDFPPVSSSHEKRMRAVFSSYIKRMLSRRGPLPSWMQEQFLHWLTFVAKQLQRHQQTILHVEDLQPDWLPKRQRAFYRWSIGGISCLVSGLLFSLLGGPYLALLCAVVFGLIGGLRIRISLIEVRWSWPNFQKTLSSYLLGGLGLGFIISLIAFIVVLFQRVVTGLVGILTLGLAALLVGPLAGLYLGLSIGLIMAFIDGWVMLPSSTRSVPNEGVRNSIKNGLFFGALSGSLTSLFVLASYRLESSQPVNLPQLVASMLVSGLAIGLIVAPLTGLLAAMQHYILRLWLWRTNRLPWKLIPFLDEAATRVLLYKVGGDYIFVHRLLLEYFALLEKQES